MRQLYSFDAETSVLGALLIAPDQHDNIAHLITPDMFYDPQTKLIYQAILDIQAGGRPIDVITVCDQLDNRGLEVLHQAGGMEFVISLAQNVPGAANIEHYAQIVRNYARERALLQVGNDIQATVMQDGWTTEERCQQAEALLSALDTHTGSGGHGVGVNDAVREFVEHLDWRFHNPGMYGVATGLTVIDERLQGLKPGELYILAARPAMGKTTYAMNLVFHAAQAKNQVYVASLEMPRLQLIQRLIASVGQVPLSKLKDASALSDPDSSARLTCAAGRLAQLGNEAIQIVDQGITDINDLRSDCRRVKRTQGGLDMVVVDYLQLLDDRTASNRFEVVSSVSRKLKALAKELGCPVVALSQLSRKCEERSDKRPILSDLRESGQIEQDADVIQFLYREEVYNEDTPNRGILEVITAKYRDGENGTDHLAFIGSQNRIADLAPGVSVQVVKAATVGKRGFSLA